MSSTLNFQCISCRKFFRRPGDLESHLLQATNCLWVRDLRSTTAPAPTPIDFHQPQTEPAAFADIPEILSENDIFIEIDKEPLPNPTPASLHNSKHHASVEESLNTDDEDIYAETIANAGKVKAVNDEVHAAYTKLQSSSGNAMYAPFSDRVDYEVSRWAIEEGPTQNAFTRLLAIDGVCKLYSYNDRAV